MIWQSRGHILKNYKFVPPCGWLVTIMWNEVTTKWNRDTYTCTYTVTHTRARLYITRL